MEDLYAWIVFIAMGLLCAFLMRRQMRQEALVQQLLGQISSSNQNCEAALQKLLSVPSSPSTSGEVILRHHDVPSRLSIRAKPTLSPSLSAAKPNSLTTLERNVNGTVPDSQLVNANSKVYHGLIWRGQPRVPVKSSSTSPHGSSGYPFSRRSKDFKQRVGEAMRHGLRNYFGGHSLTSKQRHAMPSAVDTGLTTEVQRTSSTGLLGTEPRHNSAPLPQKEDSAPEFMPGQSLDSALSGPSMKDKLHATLDMVAQHLDCRDGIIQADEISINSSATGSPFILGEGAYGYVYRGTLNRTQPVAVKVMKCPMGGAVLSPADREAKQAQHTQLLLREIALLRHLQCPHVVQYLGVAIDDKEGLMLVTEFMSGGDLRSAIQRGMVDWHRRGHRIALDIAMGLHFLHGRNVIHFDITSSNVLLTTTMQAKVADIGLAKIASSTPVTASAGNYHYMAPELIHGSCCCTQSVDMYSYGVVMWEIITGETPLRGTMRAPRVPEECPQIVSDLLCRCLDSSPSMRPTAEEVITTLQDAASRSAKPSRAKLSRQMVLMERIGGLHVMVTVIDKFYRRMVAHEQLHRFFVGVDIGRLAGKQAAFMCSIFGGGAEYQGRDLAEAHENLIHNHGLNRSHWYIMVGCLRGAMEDVGASQPLIQEVLDNLTPTKDIFPLPKHTADSDVEKVYNQPMKLQPVLLPPQQASPFHDKQGSGRV